MPASLVQVLVAGIGQELDEVIVGGDTSEELGGFFELVLLPAFGADELLYFTELLVEDPVEQLLGDFGTVVELAVLVVEQLPHLGAGDLRGRRILHEAEDRDSPTTREPGRQVLDADADVVTKAFL